MTKKKIIWVYDVSSWPSNNFAINFWFWIIVEIDDPSVENLIIYNSVHDFVFDMNTVVYSVKPYTIWNRIKTKLIDSLNIRML